MNDEIGRLNDYDAFFRIKLRVSYIVLGSRVRALLGLFRTARRMEIVWQTFR